MKHVLVLALLITGALAQNTAKYPASVATDADLGIASNRAETTLTAGITSTATSLPVLSGTQFKAGMFASIDNEFVAVCAASGNTITVGQSSCPNVDGRGLDTANGSSGAVGHLAGARVAARISAWHHNQMAAEVIALQRNASNALNVASFGAVGDDLTDDGPAIQRALDAACGPTGESLKPIYLPGAHVVGSTLHITCSGQHIYGDFITGSKKSLLHFTGTGALIQIGEDDGNWDAASYDGHDGTTIIGVNMGYTGTSRTPLLNGAGAGYGTGTTAIEDWRGGSMFLQNVYIGDFETAVFGVQSDINTFQNVQIVRCHQAFYLGPHSDQNTFDTLYSIYNDTVVRGEGAQHARFSHCQFVGDGSASTYPFEVTEYAPTSRASRDWAWTDCWFEHFYGVNVLESWIALGVGSTALNWDFRVIRPHIANNRATVPTPPYAQYLMTVDNADYVRVDSPSYSWNNPSNLLALVKFVGLTSPHAWITLYHAYNNDAPYTVAGVGTPYVVVEDYRGGSRNVRTTTNVISTFNNLWIDNEFPGQTSATINAKSGYAAFLTWRYNGALKWQDQMTTDQSRQWFDYVNGIWRFYMGAVDGDNRYRTAGTGTHKFQIADGTTVAEIDGAGKGTFNGGVEIPPLGATGKALCGKPDKSIGYCSTQPDAAGSCTCN